MNDGKILINISEYNELIKSRDAWDKVREEINASNSSLLSIWEIKFIIDKHLKGATNEK